MIIISPSATKLLADMAELGIDLRLHGDVIRYRPRDAMTPALLQGLQTHKAELLNLLNTEAVTELRQSIARLWKDPAWRSAWERRFHTYLSLVPILNHKIYTAYSYLLIRRFHNFLRWSAVHTDSCSWYFS